MLRLHSRATPFINTTISSLTTVFLFDGVVFRSHYTSELIDWTRPLLVFVCLSVCVACFSFVRSTIPKTNSFTLTDLRRRIRTKCYITKHPIVKIFETKTFVPSRFESILNYDSSYYDFYGCASLWFAINWPYGKMFVFDYVMMNDDDPRRSILNQFSIISDAFPWRRPLRIQFSDHCKCSFFVETNEIESKPRCECLSRCANLLLCFVPLGDWITWYGYKWF